MTEQSVDTARQIEITAELESIRMRPRGDVFVDLYKEIGEEEGEVVVVLIAAGSDPEEVHVALKRDQQNHEKAIYHFYRPTTEPNNRIGWAIGERK